MPRKPTIERTEQINTRDELERLISQDTEEIQGLVHQASNMSLPGRPMSGFLDYHVVKAHSDNSAGDIVISIAEFYLDPKIINEIEYVKQKSIVDKITVSNLLFQMKTAEHAIIKLLEEIDNGNTHPRTFEVLSSLQRSKMEIVKHLAQFMVIMENNYKSLKEDYRIKKAEEPHDLDEGDITIENAGNSNVMRGTKGLMQTLRDAIPEHRADGDLQKDEIEEADGE